MPPMPVLLLPTPIVETPFGRMTRPLRRDSLETFVFLGFAPEEAEKRLVVERVLMDDPDRVVSMLTTIVTQLPDRIGCSFQEYFDSYGISRELQDAIMDPEFTDIRDTASPGCWVRDAIHGRMQILEDLFTKAHFKSTLGPVAPITQEGQVAREPEDCVTMYKGVGAWRTANLKNVAKDSGLSFNYLLEKEPLRADFSWDDPEKGPRGLYFTTQKELALKFAHYATRYTHGLGSSRIIRMCVPNEFIEDEKHTNVSAEDADHAWRKVYTHCRLGRLLYIYKSRPRPARLSALIESNTIISGHVSTGHNEAPLREVQNPKHVNPLNERRDVLHVEREDGSEERAQQWMFRNCILKDLEDAVGNLGAGAFSIESVAERTWQPAFGRRALEYHTEDTNASPGGDGDSPVGVAVSHTGMDGTDDTSDGINLDTVAAEQQSSEPIPTANPVAMEQSSSEPSPTDTSKQLGVQQHSPEPSPADASIPVEHATVAQQPFEPFSTDLAVTVEQQSTKPSRNDSTVPAEYLSEPTPTTAPILVEEAQDFEYLITISIARAMGMSPTETQAAIAEIMTMPTTETRARVAELMTREAELMTREAEAANNTTTAPSDTVISSDLELAATSAWNPARIPVDFASANSQRGDTDDE